jgi:hypothetical protein
MGGGETLHLSAFDALLHLFARGAEGRLDVRKCELAQFRGVGVGVSKRGQIAPKRITVEKVDPKRGLQTQKSPCLA